MWVAIAFNILWTLPFFILVVFIGDIRPEQVFVSWLWFILSVVLTFNVMDLPNKIKKDD